jgi:replicative DNA helicase
MFWICAKSNCGPEAFYAPAHQILFNLVAELVDSNKPIDFITLKQALKDRNKLDEIGGPEYLRGCLRS